MQEGEKLHAGNFIVWLWETELVVEVQKGNNVVRAIHQALSSSSEKALIEGFCM